MSDTDLEPIGGGALQPYASPPGALTPVENQWITPQPDFLDQRQGFTQAVGNSWFGTPIQPNEARLYEQAANEIANLFNSDMNQLGMPSYAISAAIDWFKEVAMAPTPSESARHAYNLSDFQIPANDKPWLTSYLNRMSQVGASDQFVRTSLWWIAELGKRVQSKQKGQNQPRQTNLGHLSQKQLDAEADRQIQQGMLELRNRWGPELDSRLALIQKFLSNYSASDYEAITQRILPNGRIAGSDPDFLEYLYTQATGGDLPTGGALAQEIAQIEGYMKTNFNSYMKNEAMQARLRLLYERRGS